LNLYGVVTESQKKCFEKIQNGNTAVHKVEIIFFNRSDKTKLLKES